LLRGGSDSYSRCLLSVRKENKSLTQSSSVFVVDEIANTRFRVNPPARIDSWK
jgi:hypothetical protein